MDFLNSIDKVILLIPVGVIGLIRYAAWLFKRVLSSRWRDIKVVGELPQFRIGTAITVKGEPVETFRLVLEALLHEGIDQVCIVFDAGEAKNMAMTQQFARRYADQIDIRWKATAARGKRNGLMQAINLCEGVDIIICIDSDTILGEGVRQGIVQAFSHPEIGGVTVAQRVYQPSKLTHYLFDIRLKLRYLEDIPGQALGGHISCLSGRCSAYLAAPLKSVASGLPNEQWIGIHKSGGGEDKYLTTAIHDLGYKTAVVTKAVVYTRAEDSFKVYLKQSLRWARNSWFSDLRALSTRGWMWQSPLLLFYTVDRIVSTFTILLAVWVMAILLLTRVWDAALALFLWWLFTRFIKIWPYLWETKKFHLLLPYLVMTLIISALKIHAFVTLWEGSWLTRGTRRAQSLITRAYNVVYSGMTAGIIVMVGALIFVISDVWLADIPGLAELGRFYRPEDNGLVIEDDLILDETPTIIVIPEQISSDMLNTAAQAALRLNEEFYETESEIQAIWSQELSQEQAQQANLLFVGMPTGETPIVNLVRDLYIWPQLGERLADAEPFATSRADPMRVVVSPWNERNQLVLVSGQDPMRYRLNGEIVNEGRSIELITENLGPQFVVDTVVSLRLEQRAATLSGWDLRNTGQNIDGSLSRVYGLTIPPGISIMDDITVWVHLPVGGLPPDATLNIALYDQSVGTVQAIETVEEPFEVKFPPMILNDRLAAPDSNRLITVTVNIASDTPLQPIARQIWQELDHGSGVRIPTSLAIPSLATFPFPFTFNNQAIPITIVMPEWVNPSDVRLMMLLVARLGVSTAAHPPVQVMLAHEVNSDILKDTNVIILGERNRQPYARLIDAGLQQMMSISLFNLIANDTTGLLHLMRSPWNPDRLTLLVSSETLSGYEYAVHALVENEYLTSENSHAAFVSDVLTVEPVTSIDSLDVVHLPTDESSPSISAANFTIPQMQDQ